MPASLEVFTYVADPNFAVKRGAWNNGLDLPGTLEAMGAEPPLPIEIPSQLVAWDPVEQAAAWRVDQSAFKTAGVLSTAGGLVFQGTGGEFVAYDAETGDRVWVSTVGVGIMAPPVTYEVAGEQYVAVLAGLGGNALGAQPVVVENQGRLLAWKLGGDARMPTFRRKSRGQPSAIMAAGDPAAIEAGRPAYLTYCAVCHGVNAVSGGVLPDLRYSSEDVRRDWLAIVLGGKLSAGGMAGFGDVLSATDAKNIQAYVLHEAGKLTQSKKF